MRTSAPAPRPALAPLLSALLLLLAPAASRAAAPPPAAQAPARPVVLRAQRLLDVRAGRVVSPGVVVVREGRILAAGPGAAVPADADVVELGDVTLMPGLIDAHVHIDFERTDDFRQDVLDTLQKPVAERALQAAAWGERTLRAGFTTVRNLGSADVIDVSLRNAVKSAFAEGPRVLASGASIGATGGHCDRHGFAEGALGSDTLGGVADGPDALRGKVRRTVKFGADVIKVCVTGGVLSEGDEVDVPQLTQEEMDALVDEAHSLRKKVAVHAHGSTGAKRAVRAGADSLEHGTFFDDETFALMKKAGTVLVPTPLNQRIYDEQIARGASFHPKVREKIETARKARRDSLQRALKAGVRIAFGTDAGVVPHGRNAEQLAMMVDVGMRPLEALRSATLVNAELLGLAGEVGALEAGKAADVIAVPGDPLEDVRVTERVLFVMKGGKVVRREPAAAAPAR
jgi:imidazolonepropionase-like amidohydrolase